MAVVQISRIQVRRGKSLGGTGLPQLASGELAWSLDTQELYIGNGSVAEGSPAVGNTKILTERDLTVRGNLLNLLYHIYKTNDPAISTGPTRNDPVSRSTQDRLDDRVTAADFGAKADGATDDTAALQRAIDQLFLNPASPSSVNTADGTSTRVVLELGPGIYKITDTLYIPSYATIVGSGPDKTIISYTGVGPAIQFVNDSSTIGNPSSIDNTLGNTQPRKIAFGGLTVYSDTFDQTGLQLDAVRDSQFTDLIIAGNWNGVGNADSKAISLNAISALVTCSDNIFSNIVISGFSYAVWAQHDITNNTFQDIAVTDCRQGFVFGENTDGTTPGQQYGPRYTQITRAKFNNVKQHALIIHRGNNNTIRDWKLVNVGNNGSGVYFPEYPQVYFGEAGNACLNIQSDREETLTSNSFTVDLTLSQPITAFKDDKIKQTTTNVQGTLKQNYTAASNITVVTRYTTPFNNFSKLSIDPVSTVGIDFNDTPGNPTSIAITEATTTEFITSDSTDDLLIGTAIRFTGSVGGITAGTTYYVQTIGSSTHFSIANTLGGPLRNLTASTGTSVATFNPTTHPTAVGDLLLIPYIPEVSGYGTYNSYATRQIQLGYITSPSLLFTLPVSTGPSGTPTRTISYKIEYVYRSTNNNFSRRGVITLVVDIDASIEANDTVAQLTDEYNVIGISEDDALKLDISAVLLNEVGNPLSVPGDIPTSIAIQYSNTLTTPAVSNSDSGVFSYSYTANF